MKHFSLTVTDDGIWEYSPDMKSTLKTNEEIKEAVRKLL